MGLCTSRSTVSLDPSAHVLSQMEEQKDSEDGTPTWDEKLSMVQKLSVVQVIRVTEVSGVRSSGASNPHAKGYLELASKSEVEPQTSREAEEEEEEEDDTDGDLEELLNFSDSDGSLTELLE